MGLAAEGTVSRSIGAAAARAELAGLMHILVALGLARDARDHRRSGCCQTDLKDLTHN